MCIVCRSNNILQKLVLSFYHVSWGLSSCTETWAVSVFTCWAISIPHTNQNVCQSCRMENRITGNLTCQNVMASTMHEREACDQQATFEVETENWPKGRWQEWGPDSIGNGWVNWTPPQTRRSWENSYSPPSKEKSQHSKSQLDWRKAWTATPADPWEVRCLCTPSS